MKKTYSSILIVLFICSFKLYADSTYTCVQMPGSTENILSRPLNAESIIPTTHFIIHYNDPTTFEYANNTANFAEFAYQKICVELGWRVPPDDDNQGGDNRYDIYIVDESVIPGYNGKTVPEVPQGWNNEFCPNFIVIRNTIETESELKMVVAHEFNHATQLAYSYLDGYSDTWFLENTAVWVAEEIYDYQYQYYKRYFNVGFDPADPLDYPEYGIHTNYRDGALRFYIYAGFLWPKFLAEWQNNPEIVRRIYERFGENPGEHVMEDIDYVLQNYYETDLDEAARYYAEWRYFTGTRDDGLHFHNAYDLPTSRVSIIPNFPGQLMMGYGGTVFLQYPSTPDIINFSFDGQDNFKWSASVIQERYEPPTQNIILPLDNNYYGAQDFPTEGCYNLILTPIFLSYGDYKKSYTFSVTNYSGKKVFFTNSEDGNNFNLGGYLLLDNIQAIPSGDFKWLRSNSPHNIKTLSERFIGASTKKHNNWNAAYNYYFLSKPFTVTSSNYNQNARFKSLNNATIRNVIDKMSFNDSISIKFNDPWYVKDQYDNQSGMEDFISFPSPYYPTGKYNQSSGGVFLNQGADWQPPYYSVKAVAVFDTILNQTGKTHRFYFQNWSADPPNSASFKNAEALETPVVFKNPGAVVQANLKGTRLSNQTDAYSNNSQRKFLRTTSTYPYTNSRLHSVYESMGKVWYETSTDNGSTWKIMNNGKPLSEHNSKCPSISPLFSYENDVLITFQEYDGDYYNIKVLRYNYDSDIVIQDITPPCSFSGVNIANPVIQANQNTTKTHILLIWEVKNDNGPFGGYEDGLYYLVGKPNATYTGYEWTNNGVPMHISNTDGNSYTPCLTQAMNHYENPTIFHLVWEQRISSSTSRLRYYKIKAEDNYTVTFNDYNQNLSSGSGFQKNYAPSLTTLSNGAVKAVWLATRPVEAIEIPDGSMKMGAAGILEYKVIYKDLKTGQQKVYGTKTNPPTINKLNNTNKDFYFAYSEQGDLSGKVISGTDLKVINDLESIGKDVQIGNGRSESDVKANVFNSAATPLYFNLSASMNHVTPKKNMLAILTGREGIVYKDTAQFYFAVGDVIVNNLPIEFKSLPDTIQINTKELINTYLETEPFNLTDNSVFNYSVQYGITDSLAATQVLKNGRNINFKIEIVDVSTNAIIGLFDNIVYSEDSVYQYDNIAYQVNTSGIGSIQVKLRLVVNSNWEFDYALSERIAEETVLGKVNIKQINFDGNNLVTKYDLAQNYPNPFNPSTTIKYQLPKDGIVTLKVYDILGSKVATLVNEQKTAGRYEVSFDASKLASGVYIYKLQSGEYVSSKKMMLLK